MRLQQTKGHRLNSNCNNLNSYQPCTMVVLCSTFSRFICLFVECWLLLKLGRDGIPVYFWLTIPWLKMKLKLVILLMFLNK